MGNDILKLLEAVGRITLTRYDEGTVEDNLFCALRDLLSEYDNLIDSKNELQEEYDDFYRLANKYSEYLPPQQHAS